MIFGDLVSEIGLRIVRPSVVCQHLGFDFVAQRPALQDVGVLIHIRFVDFAA